MAIVSCPECLTKLQISASAAAKIRCPKCSALFSTSGKAIAKRGTEDFEVVEDEAESAPKSPMRSTSKKVQPKRTPDRTDRDEDDGEIVQPRKKSQLRPEDDEEEYEPRPKRKKRKTKAGGTLPIWLPIVGGALIVVLGLGTVAYLLLRNPNSDATNPRFLADYVDPTDPNDFGGEWPPLDAGMPPGTTVVLRITGVVDGGTSEAISERLADMISGSNFSTRSSSKLPRMAIALSPVKNFEEFAKKIDFGRVVSVNGNVISIVANKLEALPSDSFSKASREIKSKNWGRRLSGIDTLLKDLPESRRPEALKLLEPLLDDPEFPVRNKASEEFCKLATKEFVPGLLKILNSDRGDFRGNSAVKALVRLKDPRGIGPIAQRLGNFANRGDAKDALIAYGSTAEMEVVKLLRNPDPDVKLTACEILGKIGTEVSVPFLQSLTKDNNDRLRNQATSAIAEINKRL